MKCGPVAGREGLIPSLQPAEASQTLNPVWVKQVKIRRDGWLAPASLVGGDPCDRWSTLEWK